MNKNTIHKRKDGRWVLIQERERNTPKQSLYFSNLQGLIDELIESDINQCPVCQKKRNKWEYFHDYHEAAQFFTLKRNISGIAPEEPGVFMNGQLSQMLFCSPHCAKVHLYHWALLLRNKNRLKLVKKTIQARRKGHEKARQTDDSESNSPHSSIEMEYQNQC